MGGHRSPKNDHVEKPLDPQKRRDAPHSIRFAAAGANAIGERWAYLAFSGQKLASAGANPIGEP